MSRSSSRVVLRRFGRFLQPYAHFTTPTPPPLPLGSRTYSHASEICRERSGVSPSPWNLDVAGQYGPGDDCASSDRCHLSRSSLLRPFFTVKQPVTGVWDSCGSTVLCSLRRAVGIRLFSSGPPFPAGITSEARQPPQRPVMFGGFAIPSPTPMAAPTAASNKYDRGADNLGFLRALQGKHRQMIKKFVNICMSDGKKTKARALVYDTFQRLASQGDVVAILDKAVENVRPICEVKRVRIAGVTHNVPSTIAKHRQETLALRWLLEAAVKRRSTKKSLSLGQCLCDEILDASQKNGMARKKRDDLHKLAEVNRTFAHYRWW